MESENVFYLYKLVNLTQNSFYQFKILPCVTCIQCCKLAETVTASCNVSKNQFFFLIYHSGNLYTYVFK